MDAKAPKYAALYDIEDYILFSQPKYTHLRANRSPREADLVKRLDMLDRRTCKTIFDTGIGSKAARDAPAFITTLYLQPNEGKDSSFVKWFEGEMVPFLKKAHGWRRTARHEVVDSSVMSATRKAEVNTAAKYLVISGERSRSYG